MHSFAFLACLLPILAAAAPTAPAASSVTIVATAVDRTPAEALESSFKAFHDAHHQAKAAAARISTLDLTEVVMTRNELIEGKCAPIIVIFARGTTEPGMFPTFCSKS